MNDTQTAITAQYDTQNAITAQYDRVQEIKSSIKKLRIDLADESRKLDRLVALDPDFAQAQGFVASEEEAPAKPPARGRAAASA